MQRAAPAGPTGSSPEPAPRAHWFDLGKEPAMPLDLLVAIAPFAAIFILWVFED